MSEKGSWGVNKISATFLEYFEAKQHKVVDSAPMVLKDDPTLMFTNAGMNQFKDVFLGINDAINPRIADSQKCLRVSGKHNDLEEVGVDTYHHTMFEMLGNWSFGNYFKAEAIEWAWDLLTRVYGIDKNNLYVTVFGGDDGDGLETDFEAENIWKNFISPDRILRCDKKDNFWEMGEAGPCGPCSEIHVDIRTEAEKAKQPGKELVNKDHPEVIEIWNLVFMQFNRKASGELENLPNTHVDTGMGLERLAMVLQNKRSNYDTDVFTGLISKLENLSGKKYGFSDSKTDVAFRVIVDHLRAVAFAIADGQLPSNTGAGYVIRRILRRAVRYGYSFLDLKEATIHTLMNGLDREMGEFYSEIRSQKELISKVIREEEDGFLRTLSKGVDRLEALTKTGDISGKDAFELYDTFGFPIDLTELMAGEIGLKVDMVGFKKELQNQKDRSRKSSKSTTSDWTELSNSINSQFVGYDENESVTNILRYRSVAEKNKTYYQVVLEKTPFYPEGGGQVGDRGLLVQDSNKMEVIDTTKENDLIVHKVLKLEGDLNASWIAKIDETNRSETQSNHTATHLLHFVLREVLGTHVEQKGSLVSPNYLRFDFSHFQKLSEKELGEIEFGVNRLIEQRLPLDEFRSIPIQEAKEKGAMSLFGEKYGDEVRMIQFGDSKELCGGTHVKNTSEIVRFKIVHESSVAAGIRRIEAITGKALFDYLLKTEEAYKSVLSVLGNPKSAIKSIEQLKNENQLMKKELKEFELLRSAQIRLKLKDEIVVGDNGIQTLVTKEDITAQQAKDLAFAFKAEYQNLFLALAYENAGKVGITILLSDTVANSTNLKANELIREIAPFIKGGGGGQPFFATAGGKNPEGIDEALALLKAKVVG